VSVPTPRILALDCSSEYGSLALARGEHLVEQVSLHAPEGFAHRLFGEIEALLRRQSIALAEIDGFGAANGPGSFTGIRVALSAIKGLGEALSKPVFAVSNLLAVAWYGTARLRVPILDARRGEVYAAVYDDALAAVLPETVGQLSEFVLTLPKTTDLEILDVDSCLSDSGKFSTERDVTVQPGHSNYRFRPRRQRQPGLLRVTAGRQPLARAVADIAAKRLSTGARPDPASVDANYVRRSDAELHWREFHD
jgi:tRNA threonylcarbamoyladenosine biosynthesis protein TsaB